MSLPILLRLPAEIRLQIYEYVIGSRVVHVRMTWSGVCIPSGFAYTCLENTYPLLEIHQKDVLAKAVPFGADVTVLSQVCRQLHREGSTLPFRLYIWAFETAFTLDQFICMKRKIPLQCKNAIKTVAMPTPGPYRSSERVLLGLTTVLLIGTVVQGDFEHANKVHEAPSRAILPLRKSLTNGTWVRDNTRADLSKYLLGGT